MVGNDTNRPHHYDLHRKQTHKFLSKELDRMYGLDWYDLGARRYDAAAATFWTMDPLCEQYYHINPYAYCAGDPVNRMDPDGKDWYGVKNNSGDLTNQLYTIHYTDCTSQEQMDKRNIKGDYMGKYVVLFNGYYDEKLGDDKRIDGPNSKKAIATVYGKTIDDVQDYDAFTMSSDFKRYGAIKDGVYEGSWKEWSGNGSIPKNYVLNGGGPIETIDGNRTPDYYEKPSDSQKDGICIHRTNWSGFAGWKRNKEGKDIAVSLGCLLIKASQWNEFENQLGHNSFKVILQRK